MLNWSNFNHSNYLAAFADNKRREGIDVFFHPFNYMLDFTPLTQLTTGTRTLTVDGDSDFIACQTACNDLFPDLLCRIRLESTARELQNIPVEAANMFGTGQEPFFWYAPIFLPRRTALTLEVLNSTGSDRNLRFNFHGVKVYTTALSQELRDRGTA